MKKSLFCAILLCSCNCFGQAYIPMPADSAIWRYRIYDIDYETQVLDNILFLDGKDTIANGKSYHKIMSRTCRQVGGPGYNPPYVSIDATVADFYYDAMRESGKQVFRLAGAGEQLMFDFTVSVGDSIPAYTGKNKVTAIDSVLLNGVYHKRYLTTDSTYFVIEGVGSNRGVLPYINDGNTQVMRFICLADHSLTYSPDTTIPCTYIYPAGYVSAVANINEQQPEVTIFPVPASDVLHISTGYPGLLHACVFNTIGSLVWEGDIKSNDDIAILDWPKGFFFIRFTYGQAGAGTTIKGFVVE